MAASVAPTTTTTHRTTPAEAIEASSCTAESSRPKDSNSTSNKNNSNTTSQQSNTFKSHELCRSCGKTSEDLYDLYHHNAALTQMTSCTATNAPQQSALADGTMPSPFTTSSTTCYGNSSANSTATTANTTTTACLPTGTSCSSSTATATSAATFDSAAATAKATAKGQSNMENILQEMQIWHLQIKCDDGLPQRICAKCTAQFYMIHKFRRKCLKVQSQLRGLYEEQQAEKTQELKPQRHQEQRNEEEQKQQQPQEQKKDVKTTNANVEQDTKPNPTTTSSSVEEELKVPTSVDVDPATELLHLANDLNGQQQQQQSAAATLAAKSSSFNINPGHTNDTTTSPASTLQDNIVETMDLQIEQTIETEPKLSLLSDIDMQPTTAVVDVIESDIVAAPASAKEQTPTECSKKQKCDDDKTLIEPLAKRKRSSKDCVQANNGGRIRSADNIPQHTTNADNQNATKLAEEAKQDVIGSNHIQTEKRRKGRPRKCDLIMRSKSSPEFCSLVTKAALKSYSTITTRATSSAYDKATATGSTVKQQLDEDHCMPSDTKQNTLGVAFNKQQVSTASCGLAVATGKMDNDDNNNNHHHHPQKDADGDELDPQHKTISDQPKEIAVSPNSKFTSGPTKHKSKKIHKMACNSKRRAAEQNQRQFEDSTPQMEQQQVPVRLRRKCSKLPNDQRRPHHHLDGLSEKPTVTCALSLSAASPESKADQRRRRGRRRRQEADIRTSSNIEQKHEEIRQHKFKKQQRTHTCKYENETLLSPRKTLALEAENTKNATARCSTNKFTAKANLNTLKGVPTSFSPMSSPSSSSLYAAVQQATVTAPVAKNPVKALNEDYQTMLAYNTNDMKWQRRRSQRVSSSSSSSMSSSSSSSLSTTDDDDEDDDDDDEVFYEANTYNRLHDMRTSMSNNHPNSTAINPMYFWKTKAEMKANTSDMHMVDMFNSKTQTSTEMTTVDLTKPILSQNQSEEASTITIDQTNTSTCSITEGLRSQTLSDDEKEQSAKSPMKSKELNSQNCHSDHEQPDDDCHQGEEDNDGDDEHDNDEACDAVKATKDSERPEKADQKQIKLKQHSNNGCGYDTDADSEDQCSEAETNCNSMEFNNQNDGFDQKENCKQKPPISIPTNTDEATTSLTPPDNKSKSSGGCSSGAENRSRGGMKLILQRRSSTRFACLRKEDILGEDDAATASISSSPVRKRKRKQHKEEEFVSTTNGLPDQTARSSDEGNQIIRQIDETPVLDETKKFKPDQHVNEMESKVEESKPPQPETSKTQNDNIKLKTNNEDDVHMVEDTTKRPGLSLEGHKTEDSEVSAASKVRATKDATDNKLHKMECCVSTNTAMANERESGEPEIESDRKLMVRVPLASLTHHFKRMHLTKDNEEDENKEKIKDMHSSDGEGKENNDRQNQEENNDSKSSHSEKTSSANPPKETETPTKPPASNREEDRKMETSMVANGRMDHSETPAPNTAVDTKSELPTNTSFLTSGEVSEDTFQGEEPTPNDEEMTDRKASTHNVTSEDGATSQKRTTEDDQKKLSTPACEVNVKVPETEVGHIDDTLKSTGSNDAKKSTPVNNTIDNDDLFPNKTTIEESREPQNDSLEITNLHPDLLEFVQETESVGAVEDIASSQVFCGASSKITDFINDFQNNCINSPDVEADGSNMDVLPSLPKSSNPHLSDEIRDVEDTLNGILSEMHDRDMYTPRSGETEDFLAHSSIYSPMTDAPTTPSQSLYAESPRTVNSNPMSLSPFIQSNMDYNAMTPQSNHSSSMSGHTTATMSSNSSHPSGGVSSDHFPTYTDCFAEESTQSELIGFQNDIPCFENIELSVNGETVAEVIEMPNESQEPETPSKQVSNKDLLESLDKEADLKKNLAEFPADKLQPSIEPGASPLSEFSEIAAVVESSPAALDMPEPNMEYDNETMNTVIIQTDAPPASTSDATPPPHQQYLLTNTSHGPVFISTPPEHPQQQNVQYVTLDSNNSAPKLSWSNQAAPAAAATYFVNTSGEIYLSNPSFNTLMVPQQQATTQGNNPMETNDNYVQVYQDHQQQQHLQQNNGNASQYIMVVNNLSTGAQQYLANPSTTPTVLLHTQVTPNSNCNYISSQTSNGEMDINSAGNATQVSSNTMSTFSIATSSPGQHATVSLAPEEPPVPAPHRELSRQDVQKLLQQKIQQQKPIKPRILHRDQKINLICRFCHKRPKFTNNVDYSNHIITMHPAEKPYNCDYCPKHFQRRGERQDHVAQVHGSRYQCAQCGVTFCAQRALDFHLQKFHASTISCTIPPRIATVAPTQQSSTSSTPAVHHLQQNSTSSTSSSSLATSSPSTYHLLHTAQQQRLVHAAEDVHAHNEDEEEEAKTINNNNNKCSFDSQLDLMDETTATHQQQLLLQQQNYQKPTRKLCCPDCDGDDESCCSLKNNPQNDHKQLFNQQQYAGGNLSDGGGDNQQPHITIPSPEQTEPDSTTTLRHFRKNPMKSPTSAAVSTTCSNNNSSCTTYSACAYSNSNSNKRFESSSGVAEYYRGEKYISRDLYTCHLCEDAFTTANALRKHRNIAHNNHCTMPFICTICKRGFRLRNALQRHMETHDAEGRPYECNICQVRFPRPSQLTLHKLTVHKFEKVHTCNECGKQFGTESSLKAHEKVAHEANSMPLPFACVYLEAPKHQKPKVSKD